jgi:hypothetical protein
MAPEDAHELRHLWAAINGGNSDGCGDGCLLDRLSTPAMFPSVWWTPVQEWGQPRSEDRP